jgi:hypothetical protein
MSRRPVNKKPPTAAEIAVADQWVRAKGEMIILQDRLNSLRDTLIDTGRTSITASDGTELSIARPSRSSSISVTALRAYVSDAVIRLCTTRYMTRGGVSFKKVKK